MMGKREPSSLSNEALTKLETSLYKALQTYSNVHRGTGYHSMVTTALYEQARDTILDLLELDQNRYEVIFCTPRGLEAYQNYFHPQRLVSVTSEQLGLPIGICAVAIKQTQLPKGPIFETGGGTVRMVYPSAVVWSDTPNRFEAGTPSIINAIALAKAFQIVKHQGKEAFNDPRSKGTPISEIFYQDKMIEHAGKKLLTELQKTLIGGDVRVPTVAGAASYVNFDNGASTPTFEPIWDTVRSILRQPKSKYPAIIQEVRNICANFLGAPADEYEVIFTSNTTDAINLVAQSFSHESDETVTPVVVTTLLEHNSNELPWRYFSGATVLQIPVNEEGFLDLHQLEELFQEYNQLKQHGTKRIRILAMSG
ncbi:MAG: aminotransferase class V-fold PLP-dependent enzyme, partial [Candidatus Hermodarchaeia archaeon]